MTIGYDSGYITQLIPLSLSDFDILQKKQRLSLENIYKKD
jgi:hypothetical protein